MPVAAELPVVALPNIELLVDVSVEVAVDVIGAPVAVQQRTARSLSSVMIDRSAAYFSTVSSRELVDLKHTIALMLQSADAASVVQTAKFVQSARQNETNFAPTTLAASPGPGNHRALPLLLGQRPL